jgi:hypothetical protein
MQMSGEATVHWRLGIEDHKVRVGAGSDRRLCARLRPAEPRGRRGHPFSDPLSSPMPRCFMLSKARAAPGQGLRCRPRPGPSGPFRAASSRAGRGVVGGHHVDQAFFERLPQRLAILRAANRRRAFEFGCAIRNVFGGKPQVMTQVSTVTGTPRSRAAASSGSAWALDR